MPDEPLPSKMYRVKLGHSEVSVKCGSKEEAIRLARTKLSSDLARLYDVIHRAEDEQFEVIEVEGLRLVVEAIEETAAPLSEALGDAPPKSL